MSNKSYNLVNMPFLPISGGRLCSLRGIFEQDDAENLALDTYHYYPVMSLLFCIGQAAVNLENKNDWYNLSFSVFKDKVISYLQKHIDCFDLYGDPPFLQIKELSNIPSKKGAQNLGLFIPDIRLGNNLVVRQQFTGSYCDGEKALHLIALQIQGLAGKRVDNSILLSPEYKGKSNDRGNPSSGAVSPMLGKKGFIHSFYLGRSVAETVWLNLLSREEVAAASNNLLEMGRPCWELKVTSEDCQAAQEMKSSYLGRLVPLVRFCLLQGDNIICTDGIAHQSLSDNVAAFTLTISIKNNTIEAKTVKSDVQPWRELGALLSFLNKSNQPSTEHCKQLSLCYEHCRNINYLAIWSGGVELSFDSGEQKVSGNRNYINSIFKLSDEDNPEFTGDIGFVRYKEEIADLQKKAYILKSCISRFFADLMSKKDKDKLDTNTEADKGVQIFWEQLNLLQNNLINLCFYPYETDEEFQKHQQNYHNAVKHCLLSAYQTVCPSSTARTLSAYIRNRPMV